MTRHSPRSGPGKTLAGRPSVLPLGVFWASCVESLTHRALKSINFIPMIVRSCRLLLLLGVLACSAPPVPSISLERSNLPPPTETPAKPVLPVKSLPRGWILNGEPIANWSITLTAVLGLGLDTTAEVAYWEDPLELPTGMMLPLKRAKLVYQHDTRITVEQIELQFINVDYIYSITNYEPSHYILEQITKTVEMKKTGFPQLTADDVLRHKILFVYGTPKEFDGTWHTYADTETEMKVRVVDDFHVTVQMHSLKVEQKLRQAIEDVYSEEGIENRKQELLQGIDL